MFHPGCRCIRMGTVLDWEQRNFLKHLWYNSRDILVFPEATTLQWIAGIARVQ